MPPEDGATPQRFYITLEEGMTSFSHIPLIVLLIPNHPFLWRLSQTHRVRLPMRSLNILLTYESAHAACEIVGNHMLCVWRAESGPAPPTWKGWNKLIPGVRDTGGYLDLLLRLHLIDN